MPKWKKVKKCLKFADIGIVILEKELAKLYVPFFFELEENLKHFSHRA